MMVEGFSLNSYLLGGLIAGVFVYACGLARSRRVRSFDLGKAHSEVSFRQLAHIPTLGPSDPLASCWSAIKYVTSATQIVQKGFDKVGLPPSRTTKDRLNALMRKQYREGAFKVPTLFGWLVVLNPSQMDEVAKVPSSVLSSMDAMADVCSTKDVYCYMLICDEKDHPNGL